MKILKKLIHRRHQLMVVEEQLVETLKVIERLESNISSDTIVEMIRHSENGDKWFIRFVCNDHDWETLRNELNIVRVFDYLNIPEEKNIYTTD